MVVLPGSNLRTYSPPGVPDCAVVARWARGAATTQRDPQCVESRHSSALPILLTSYDVSEIRKTGEARATGD